MYWSCCQYYDIQPLGYFIRQWCRYDSWLLWRVGVEEPTTGSDAVVNRK